MKSVHVIANPQSGGGRGRRVLPELEPRLEAWAGGPARALLTEAPGHGYELASRLIAHEAPGPIVVVGGDGTLHEVANAILESGSRDFPLVPLPVGTGNDFHRMLRAGKGVGPVMDSLAHGEVRAFEAGHVRWEGGSSWFVNLLGVGLDVEVLRRRRHFRLLPGLLQYLAALPPALAGMRHPSLDIQLESGEESDPTLRDVETLIAAFTVGPSVGGGFLLSPDAVPDDGMLNLFHVERLRIRHIIRYLPRVLRGTHSDGDRIHLRTLDRARVEDVDGIPLRFELDGELMDSESTWLEIEVRPGVLPVLDAASPSGSGRHEVFESRRAPDAGRSA